MLQALLWQLAIAAFGALTLLVVVVQRVRSHPRHDPSDGRRTYSAEDFPAPAPYPVGEPNRAPATAGPAGSPAAQADEDTADLTRVAAAMTATVGQQPRAAPARTVPGEPIRIEPIRTEPAGPSRPALVVRGARSVTAAARHAASASGARLAPLAPMARREAAGVADQGRRDLTAARQRVTRSYAAARTAAAARWASARATAADSMQHPSPPVVLVRGIPDLPVFVGPHPNRRPALPYVPSYVSRGPRPQGWAGPRHATRD